MVSGGCIISGAEVRKSVLFSNVNVRSYTFVDQSVILPDVTIGMNCRIKKAIIDRGCHVPDGMSIGIDHEEDKVNGFRVTANGVVLVTRGMLGQEEGFA
jgi:glucose-1-phosphate adenylyltransferase